MYIDADQVTALRGACRIGIFFRLGTDPALHLWMGTSDIPAQMPSLDVDGTVYTGAGQLLSLPDLEVLINGLAASVTFSMSGFSPAMTADIQANAPSVAGALATIGFVGLDERWQPTGSIIPLWTGTADYIAEEQKVEPDPKKSPMRIMSLICYNGDSTRARPDLLMFTPASQSEISATDTFFERVARYVQTLIISWPRF